MIDNASASTTGKDKNNRFNSSAFNYQPCHLSTSEFFTSEKAFSCLRLYTPLGFLPYQ